MVALFDWMKVRFIREIIAESNFVKAGIIYIVEKVEAGYVYIKSGF